MLSALPHCKARNRHTVAATNKVAPRKFILHNVCLKLKLVFFRRGSRIRKEEKYQRKATNCYRHVNYRTALVEGDQLMRVDPETPSPGQSATVVNAPLIIGPLTALTPFILGMIE